MALQKERKALVVALLEIWRESLPRCPLATSASLAILLVLADKYPDVFLDFVASISVHR